MYNNIKLEKGLYSITGKTFTQALAELAHLPLLKPQRLRASHLTA